jgi:NTE family protein
VVNGRKRIGLALGGGVVRGAAHIGVLSVLERAGIPIDCVAGASAGALMGAAYCSGVGLPKIKEMALRMRWRDVISLTWPSQGLVSFDKLERWMVAAVGDLEFADLKLPFAAVATDLESGQPVILREGRVAPAVRASSSVPGLVKPARLNGRLLGDGNVTDNVPVQAARALGADYIIGVDIFTPALRLRWGPLGYAFAALEILLHHAGGGLEAADCLIVPKLAGFSYVRFSRSAELMALGERAAEEKLAIIQNAISN